MIDLRNVSISEGTLNDLHLLQAFADFLEPHRLTAEALAFIEKGEENWTEEDKEEIAFLINEEMFDAIDERSPEGYHFSAHEGNGSDFGFWQDEEEETEVDITEQIREIELMEIPDGSTVLHHVVADGTSAMVYDTSEGVRWYRAMEYIEEEGSACQQYGYVTKGKHHYMGERYRTLWGEYESEVYSR